MKKRVVPDFNDGIRRCAGKIRRMVSGVGQRGMERVRRGVQRSAALSETGIRFVRRHWESIRYYGALGVVLTVLAMFSYSRRSGDVQEELRYAPPISDSPVAAQAIPEPTYEPEPELLRPASGEIVGAYCADSLEWNEVLGQWQTHAAVDFSAAPGEAIVAIADGVVLDAYWDPLYGNIIVVDHGEGRMARYGSLSTLELVEVGEQVQRGEILSAAGECSAEESLGSHLHLEYYENGEAADFSACLTE